MGQQWSRTPRAIRLFVVFLVYLGFAVLRYWPVLGHMNSQVNLPGGDAAIPIWSLGWAGHLVVHGGNPFHSSWLQPPVGFNLLANTTVLTLGIVMAPVTLLVGPVASYNLTLVLAFALTATTTYVLLRRWTDWAPAALMGGLAFVWSGYMIEAGLIYPNLAFVAAIPLLILCIDHLLVSQDRPPLRWGIALGVIVVLQFFISPELLIDTIEVCVAGLLILAAAHRRQVVEHLRRAISGLGAALGIVVVCLAYPAWYAVFGPQSGVFRPRQNALYGADLLGPLMPTSNQLATASSLRRIGDSLSGGPVPAFGHHYVVTDVAYLGIPLIVVVLAVVIIGRRRRLVQFLGLMAVLTFLGALGPQLKFHNHLLGVTLPAVVLPHLPLIRETSPERYMLFTDLAAVALAVIGLQGAKRRTAIRPRWLAPATVAVLVLVALAPATYTALPLRIPSFFTGPQVQGLPLDSVVLTYPFPGPGNSVPMVWQADSKFRFKLVGGYMLSPAANAPPSSTQEVLDQIAAGEPVTSLPLPLEAKVHQDLRYWNVNAVVVALDQPHAVAAAALFGNFFGHRPNRVGGVDVWYVAGRGTRTKVPHRAEAQRGGL